ncbi:hypothetical protein VTP01DRAFT_1742 [Rhizomucor pusillus]|uniref:uncharacterized protein n=1 Tax=Rhizomucor pusillus TaxID=4840 RepID=UPI0037433199
MLRLPREENQEVLDYQHLTQFRYHRNDYTDIGRKRGTISAEIRHCTREGAEKLLNTKHMSDDEDIIDPDNVVVGRRVLRPTWRSFVAQCFFQHLSGLVEEKSGSRGRDPDASSRQ